MNVLYDHQAFSAFAFGGVSRIYFELLNAYAKDPEMTVHLSLQYSDNEYLKDSEWNATIRPFLHRISHVGGIRFPLHITKNFIVKRINNHRRKENKEYSERMIEDGKYDIFHPTYYDPYFLDLLHGKPFVITVYDMIYELFPEYFPSTKKFLDGKLLLLRKAAKIIAISESTKRDLIRLHQIPGEKIDVVYLASSITNETANQLSHPDRKQIPERYLLYVGNRALYKNFLFFIESLVPLLRQDPSLSVVCAGGKNFSAFEIKSFSQWGVEKNLHYVPVNDVQLSLLYKNALAFVFPSLYEGFGIPILEAFACNCPVLISNTSSLSEIAGNACLSFDPKNKTSMLDAVKQVLSSKSIREELRKQGRERVKLFSWERTARETKRVYKNVLQTT
jgi:glycosyltransferase involved in cell wall biosynthesis